MSGIWFPTEGGSSGLWALTESAVASVAPASVSATATGGTTLTIDWTPGAGGGAPDGFDVQVEVPAGSANWVAAAGAVNPAAGSAISFAATGLAPATSYTPRVRSKKAGFSDSAWTVGVAVSTDNVGSGGGVIGSADGTAPTLTGSIVISGLTSSGYTATCPPGSDAVGVTGYQWRLGGTGSWTDIPSSGRAATFTGRTPASTDLLEMRCRDAAGNFSLPLSTSVTLLGIAPAVTAQPSAASVVAGALASFTAAFSGTPAPTLQWYRNGAPISGATAATYSLTTTIGDTGSIFTCTATNMAGSVTTNAVTLTVTPALVAPSIVTQPASQTVVAGQPVTFTVVAAGTTPLAYQWRRNGAAISGATSSSYTFTTSAPDTGAVFSVLVSNGAGSLASAGAALTVDAAGFTPSAARTWTVYADVPLAEPAGGATILSPIYLKDPQALLDYSWNLAPYLDDLGDQVAATEVFADGTAVVDSIVAAGSLVTAFVSGVAVGEVAELKLRFTTEAGRTDERTIRLQGVQR